MVQPLHPTNPVRDPALTLITPPRSLRLVALAMGVLFPFGVLVLLFMPWQQNVLGSGRVIAFHPQDRQQDIDAPISGRVQQWFVIEGQQVEQGQPLLQITDNDPDWLARLKAQQGAAERELAAAEAQLISYQTKLKAARVVREGALTEYDSKLAQIKSKLLANQSELETAELNLTRTEMLADEGIVSTRKLELARNKRQKSRADVRARQDEYQATLRAQQKAIADSETKIASTQAELEAARSKVAMSERKLLDLQAKFARQQTQLVRAPRSGRVLRLHGVPGSRQVKAGDPLVSLVPDIHQRAVELWVDGNDMPWVMPGEPVRLVFEGWPALQFVGLPGAEYGTYAGKVAFVNAADDGKGSFRVVVIEETPDTWPDINRLRQGVLVKGWILLGRVPIGYELWRQINGFPPLPKLDKGTKPLLPTNKKPRAPARLKEN